MHGQRCKSLEKELARLKGKLASSQGDDLAAQAVDVKGVKVLAATLDGADAKTLARDDGQAQGQAEDRGHRAWLRSTASKVQLAAGVTADTHGQGQGRRPGQLRRAAGRRQGRRASADMAMAGGSDPSKLAPALASVQSWAQQRL